MPVPFFWLHIKKCGGESFRETFTPPYVQTDRVNNPKPFIALPKNEWNDALNNFRIPLGEYDNKRMLFAKKYLYSEQEFLSMYKFVIVRNPYDRIVSAWKYLLRREQYHPRNIRMKNCFKAFLNELPLLWEKKFDRHMFTHTAPIWPDITDEQGKLLVNLIIKLENIDNEVQKLNQVLGVSTLGFQHINRNRPDNDYKKHYDQATKDIVEKLYYNDIKHLGYGF